MQTRKQPKAVSEQEALARLQTLCAQAEHSSGEMREKMRRWQLTPEAQERILEQLVSERFIDDERFSRIYVREKIRFDHWGRRKLEQGLYNKGIARATIAQALSEVPQEDYVAVLRPLLDSKRRTLKADSDYELSTKLVRFALGRGFTFDVIRLAMDGADDVDIADDDSEEFL